MAFITVSGQVVSFAEAQDIQGTDQRIFECNEIDFATAPNSPTSLAEYLEDLARKSTARICQRIRASAQWRVYLNSQGVSVTSQDLPDFVPSLIRSRKQDFTDLCCYYTLKEYLIPKIATFEENSPENLKIQYYDKKFADMLEELLQILDWYDLDNSGTVQPEERVIRPRRLRRSRGYQPTVVVR